MPPSPPIHDRATIGAAIRRRRHDLRLTQADAAARCGVSRRLFYQLESGTREVALGTVLRILDRLGFDLRLAPRDSRQSAAPATDGQPVRHRIRRAAPAPAPAPAPAYQPEPEWADWYRLSPQERWRESSRLWDTYLLLGGTFDPEPDTQSPFFDASARRSEPAHGRSGVHLVRRGGV